MSKITSTSTASTPYRNIVTTNSSIPISTPYTNTITSGSWAGIINTNSTNSTIDILDGKSLNLEKLEEMSPERRTSILSIISSLAVSTDYSVRKLLLNTLESYNLLEDKDVVSRKAKIESVVR